MCRDALQSRIRRRRLSRPAATHGFIKLRGPAHPAAQPLVYEKSREQHGGEGTENVTARPPLGLIQRDPVGAARPSERDRSFDARRRPRWRVISSPALPLWVWGNAGTWIGGPIDHSCRFENNGEAKKAHPADPLRLNAIPDAAGLPLPDASA